MHTWSDWTELLFIVAVFALIAATVIAGSKLKTAPIRIKPIGEYELAAVSTGAKAIGAIVLALWLLLIAAAITIVAWRVVMSALP